MAHKKPSSRITRRALLRSAGAAAGGLALSPLLPPRLADALSAAPQPQTTARRAARPQVAIAQASTYDEDVIREAVITMLDQLGGLGDIVKRGDRVAIKVNLTGGTGIEEWTGIKGTETYVTHPAVTRALCEAVLDAGAKEVSIVEAIYDPASWAHWGSRDIAKDLGVKLVDLNQEDPYDDFLDKTVGDEWLMYPSFIMNRLLDEVDIFMSLTKLKCHATAGVTLGMKNLVGLVPMQFYQRQAGDTNRSAFHGLERQGNIRIPSIVMDLVRARPIHFTLIDGIKTAEGSEGPWNTDFNPIEANVLIAGKDMVATDTVGAAVMGFNPEAASFAEAPFHFCLNHLQLASALGLGSNKLDDVEIVGAALEDVVVQFRPYAAHLTAADVRAALPYGGRIERA